jgi:hypothetical protein
MYIVEELITLQINFIESEITFPFISFYLPCPKIFEIKVIQTYILTHTHARAHTHTNTYIFFLHSMDPQVSQMTIGVKIGKIN